MSSLNPSEVMMRAPDVATYNTQGPFSIDMSSEYETFCEYTTNAAPRVEVAGNPLAYNSVPVTFQLDVDPSTRIRFDKSYMKINYICEDMANPLIPVAVLPASCSIPWHTAAAVIN